MKWWYEVVGLLLVLAALGVASSVSALSDTDSSLLLNSSINESLNNVKILDKDVYELNETVSIYFEDLENIEEVSINVEEGNYRFIGILEIPLEFRPPKAGDYSVDVIFRNGTNQSIGFKVVESMIDGEEILISTNKKEYFVGENVLIHFNFTIKEEYNLLIVSEKGIFQYLGIPESPLEFIPGESGAYRVELMEDDVILSSSYFYVKEEEVEDEYSVYADREEYEIGERVEISFLGNVSEIRVLSEDESFYFLNPLETIEFMPKRSGLYEIIAFFENNVTRKDDFYVKAKEDKYDYFFPIDKDIVITVYLSDKVEDKKTVMDRIFGTSPITSVKAYVENHSEDKNFNLSLEQLGESIFRVKVESNLNIKPGHYALSVEVSVNEDVIKEEVAFLWGNISEEKEEIMPVVNETAIVNITKHIGYYFTLDEMPYLEVDFTGEIEKQRTILDAALRKPLLTKISAYVEGEEDNADFAVNIAHIEFDKFSFDALNDNAKADVYKLIVVGKIDNEFFTRQVLFDWGIEDIPELTERISIKNKSTSLEEILDITKINVSEEAIPEINKTEVDITPINETKIYKTNITIINESDESISINDTKINITDLIKEKINFSLYTNKKEYNLGELVYVSSNANITRLQIFSGNVSFFYTDAFADNMSFAPPIAGDYTIEATAILDGSIEVLATSFGVISNVSLANISLIPSEEKIGELSFSLLNNKGEVVRSIIRIFDNEGSQVEELGEDSTITGFAVYQPIEITAGEYDVEIVPENIHVKSI
ncbi:MAG: hypothetical protein U9O94_05020, partial [Nanoarchaeota archaeon]|nr:hypothetical protein [Nanoarchaeota archaeon]